MTELQTLTQEAYQAHDRVVERRKEIFHRLDELTKKPQRNRSTKENMEIHTLIQRLKALIV